MSKIRTFFLAVLLATFVPATADQTTALKAGEEAVSINAVPYLSTYYIEPKVKQGSDAVIKYYVTDSRHRDYLEGYPSAVFTVEYWVNGQKTVLSGVKAGDNTLTLKGLLQGKVIFALQSTDAQGRKSHRLFQEFRVTGAADAAMPADKVLAPDLKKFGISNNDARPVETTAGLTALLQWAVKNGYRKVVLPKGRYRIDENSSVWMASGLTLDMNGSVFKLNPSALAKVTMFKIVDCIDSHVLNGTFEGDLKEHDFKNAPNNSEWVNAVEMGKGAEYCSFENVKIVDVTGYGSNTGIMGREGAPYSDVYPVETGTFVPGDIDAAGAPAPSTVRTTTEKFIDISAFQKGKGFFQLGSYLGYQGNAAGNWVYKASFYDAQKNFVESIEGYLYRRLYLPKNAHFVRITLLSTATPGGLSLFDFHPPYNCAFINVHHENVRCVGMCPSGFTNLLVQGNTFENCGWELARCAFDSEDGWDLMQDLTFRNNKFGKNPGNEFLTAAGHNFVVENNQMSAYMWDRTRSAVYRNNIFKSGTFMFGSRERTGYTRISGNTFAGAAALQTEGGAAPMTFAARDNIYQGGVSAGHNEQGVVAGFYRGGEITGGSVNARVEKCKIRNTENAGGGYEIYESEIENCILKTSGYKLQSKIVGCNVKNSQVITVGGGVLLQKNILGNVTCHAIEDWSDGHEYILRDNKIVTSLGHLVYISNSFNQVTLERNVVQSSSPGFSAIYLNNPTNEKLTKIGVTVEGNRFSAQGGSVLNIPRLPPPTCSLTLRFQDNIKEGITEYAQDLTNLSNIHINPK